MAGNPDEYFAPELRPLWTKKWGSVSSDREYLDKAIERSTTPNGICGFKLFNLPDDELTYFKRLLCERQRYSPERQASITRSELPKLFAECFPGLRYIWLTRRDRIRQAISYYRARETKIWFVFGASEPEKREKTKPVYSYQEIDRILGWLALQDSLWTEFFIAAKVQPLTVIYEDLVSDYDGTLRMVLKYLEVPYHDPIPLLPTGLRKQATEESDRWASRFYQEKLSGWRNPDESR
jgi:trehalose 2-sulfotransferase